MSPPRKNRKRRRNRGRFGFLFKLLCALTLIVALTAGATVFFQVESITVTGNNRYTQAEVVAATGIEPGMNLFRLNKFQIARQVMQALPYVTEMNIRRALPNAIFVVVTETEAAAHVRGEGEDWLISASGKLLEPVSGESDLPGVTGVTLLLPRAGTPLALAQEEQGKQQGLIALLSALEEMGQLDQVGDISLSASQIRLRYLDRFDVLLPLNGDFNYELRVLEKAVETLDVDKTGRMDLTQKDYAVVFSPE